MTKTNSASHKADPDRRKPKSGSVSREPAADPSFGDESMDPQVKSKLSDQAYEQLEELIVTCQLPPGAVFLENQLAERIGIGRTPVRDAVNRLSREGLTRIVPRVGVVIAEVNIENQLKLLELRREIERFLVRCAARRANESEKESFREIETDMITALRKKDIVLFARADAQFNALVSKASRNELAAEVMRPLQSRARRYWYLHHGGRLSERGVECHIAIARAIAAGTVDAAEKASEELMDYIQGYTRAALPTF